MFAIYEFRTNEQGIMTDELKMKTPNPIYAQSKIFELAASAVASQVYVHTILCVNEHGAAQFNTPMYFEHIGEEEQTSE